MTAIPGIREAHSDKIVQLLKLLPPKGEAILFGSRAKGCHREGSDIDIALKGAGVDLQTRDLILAKYEDLNLPWKLDLIVYSLIQEPALRDHIDRVGVRLRMEPENVLAPQPSVLLGKTESHVVSWSGAVKIHKDIVAPFRQMKDRAAKAGFGLEILSGFRSFDAQCKIWNAKVKGERPILDDQNNPIDISGLSPWEVIQKILRWSALPGTSRHHWGTDVDVFDSLRMTPGYKIQLVSSEYADKGIFSALSEWLDDHMDVFGFFRPYDQDRGGVSPERWHLSYGPMASGMPELLTVDLVRTAIESADIEGKAEILKRLPDIFSRYVASVAVFR